MIQNMWTISIKLNWKNPIYRKNIRYIMNKIPMICELYKIYDRIYSKMIDFVYD